MESSGIGQFIPLILIFVIFYFFLIRPQQKKVKEHKAMVESLKKGDKIVTSGGITGTITRVVDNDKIEVEIADNVTVEVIRGTGVQSLNEFSRSKKINLIEFKVLYFSKLRIIFISLISLFFILIASSNFLNLIMIY